MDLCSLEDAFPNIDTGSVHRGLTEPTSSGFPFVGGTDSKPSREERRAARKRAKKVKGPALTYSDSVMPDPDRPAVRRMDSVGTIQDEKEGFKIPILPKASCLFSDDGTPAYFGKDVDDEEGFSSFSAVGNDNPNYMLGDVTKTFDMKGVAKAGGILPEPNLSDTWKPMSAAASYTAFVGTPDSPDSPDSPEWSMNADHGRRVASKSTIPTDAPTPASSDRKNTDDRDVLMGHINKLVSRLENLEKKKSQDSQTEILMFVGTGVFLLLSFEFFTRR